MATFQGITTLDYIHPHIGLSLHQIIMATKSDSIYDRLIIGVEENVDSSIKLIYRSDTSEEA